MTFSDSYYSHEFLWKYVDTLDYELIDVTNASGADGDPYWTLLGGLGIPFLGMAHSGMMEGVDSNILEAIDGAELAELSP